MRLRELLPTCLLLVSCGQETASAEVAMKTVTYGAGLVTFRIPSHWTDEREPDGTGLFRDAESDSVLFLTVFKMRPPKENASPLEALQPDRDEGCAVELLPNGNALATKVERQESNSGATMHTWTLCCSVPPSHMRTAFFTLHPGPGAHDVVALLDREVRAAQISKALGQ